VEGIEQVLRHHSGAVRSVAWPPHGRSVAWPPHSLASGSLGGTLGTGRDSSTAGGTMQVLQHHTDSVRFVAAAPWPPLHLTRCVCVARG